MFIRYFYNKERFHEVLSGKICEKNDGKLLSFSHIAKDGV